VTAVNDLALLRLDETDQAVILLREGDYAPGCGPARVGTISVVDALESGQWVALVTLATTAGGASSANNQALYSGVISSGGSLTDRATLRLRKGARFQRGGSEMVKSIMLPTHLNEPSGAGAVGLSHLVNTSGRVAALVTFGDGRKSSLVLSP
jgi:hypothetical protein